tara:strand:- start:1599 stop:1820 length:222 start_codon:yes stop_codon:yes gene_type:complete
MFTLSRDDLFLIVAALQHVAESSARHGKLVVFKASVDLQDRIMGLINEAAAEVAKEETTQEETPTKEGKPWVN